MKTSQAIGDPETSVDLVKIYFRQVFDTNGKSEFEKQVWEESFEEYKIQIQSFDTDGKLSIWSDLINQYPKAKINVTYKTGFAIGLFVKSLNNRVPHVKDSLGMNVIPFKNWALEIVDSNAKDKQRHRVAITYETEEVELKAVVGDFIVVTIPGSLKNETLTIRLQEGVSINSYRTIPTALI